MATVCAMDYLKEAEKAYAAAGMDMLADEAELAHADTVAHAQVFATIALGHEIRKINQNLTDAVALMRHMR